MKTKGCSSHSSVLNLIPVFCAFCSSSLCFSSLRSASFSAQFLKKHILDGWICEANTDVPPEIASSVFSVFTSGDSDWKWADLAQQTIKCCYLFFLNFIATYRPGGWTTACRLQWIHVDANILDRLSEKTEEKKTVLVRLHVAWVWTRSLFPNPSCYLLSRPLHWVLKSSSLIYSTGVFLLPTELAVWFIYNLHYPHSVMRRHTERQQVSNL